MITEKFFATLSLNVIAFIAMAQPGTLDSTFGINGMETPELYPNAFGHAVAMESDGKILTAEGTWAFNQNLFAVARLNSDGSVDSTFGLNGVASILMDSVQNYSTSIAIQPDGKIVLAGYEGSGNYELPFVLVRFNADGSVDNIFGQNGKVVTLVGHGYISTGNIGIALQSDGKIVLASGVYSDPAYVHDDFALIRYNTNGSLDNSFGNNGTVITDISGNNYDAARDVTIQGDGKIIAGGLTIQNYEFDFALARFNVDGAIDSTFGISGRVIAAVDSPFYNSDGNALLIQPDGKIIMGGTVSKPSYYFEYIFALMRFNINGSIDNTFGVNGATTTDFYKGIVTSLLIQPDGKIIAAGNTLDTIGLDHREFAIARYNLDGSIDNSFGINGKVTSDFSEEGSGADAVLQSDGKIVMVGGAISPSSFSAARFFNDAFTCSANFTLFPDTLIPHHYWALNQATGISPVSYLLNWGDGTYDSIAYPSHTYASGGFYNICLTVLDSTGCTTTYCSYSQVQKMSAANSENDIIHVDVVSSLSSSIENANSILLSCSIFPNPASGNSFINYTLSTPATVSIDLYDVLGNKLQQLLNSSKEQGEHNLPLNTSKLANGVYLLQLRAGDQVEPMKVVILH